MTETAENAQLTDTADIESAKPVTDVPKPRTRSKPAVKIQEAKAEVVAPAEAPQPVQEVKPEIVVPVIDQGPWILKIKNNGPRSYETYTRTVLEANQETEIMCESIGKREAIKKQLSSLNALAGKPRYTVVEV